MSREEQERCDVRAGENAARVGGGRGFLGLMGGVGLRGADVPVLWRNKGESEGEGPAERAVVELGGATGLVVLVCPLLFLVCAYRTLIFFELCRRQIQGTMCSLSTRPLTRHHPSYATFP